MKSKHSLQRAISMVMVPAILIILSLFGAFFRDSDTDFSRGVLALNTDSSHYLPGDPVMLQMSSLDKNGDTLCQTNLELEIDVPNQWSHETITSAQGQIQRSASCSPDNNVTNEPDYLARFIASTPGEYRLKLKNLDTGKTVKSSFVVQKEASPLRVSRTSATRINPFKSDRYPMVITVTANQDFKGRLIETLPADFAFAWIGPATNTQTKQHQVLSWDVDLKAGESKEFAYEYDAPDLSPGFFRLMPAQLFAQGTTTGAIFTELRTWQIASDAAPTGEGMLIYDPDGNLQEAPHYREWTTTDLGTEGDMMPYAHTTTVEDINHTIVKAASTRNEYIRGTLSEFGHLDIQLYNGSTWSEATGSNPTISNGDFTTGIGATNAVFRGFDIAYEDSSGDALVVYEDSSSADGILKYRTWNGTSWSDEASLDYTAADESADVAVWVELESDVGSDNILAAWHDKNNDTILAAVWDGSAWQDITQMTGAGLAETHGQTFDVAWEATSGEGMVAYGTGTTTAYRVYTASAFAAAGASPANPAEAVNWLSLAGDWDTDYIALMINSSASGTDVGSADALADIWNGTNWTTIAGPTDDSDTNSPGLSKGSDVMWEPTGDRALFVYRDGASSETFFRYFLYDISANQWQAIEDGTHCLLTEGGTGTIEVVTSLNVAEDSAGPCTFGTAVKANISGITLAPNPANSQIMVLASNELTLALSPEIFRWNGDANATWLTQTATMGSIEADNSPGTLPMYGYRPLAYDFAFRDSGADSTGLFLYDEDGANEAAPRYRTWSGTDLGSESSLTASEALADADEAMHSIIEAAPTRDEYVAGMLTASGDLVVQVWNGSSWGYGTGAPTDGVFQSGVGTTNAVFRSFDISYENTTGDALVVYEDSSATNGILKYRTWNGTTWSGESTLDYTTVDESVDVAVWVELENDIGSDNILATWHDKTNDTIIGARWDGSAWQHLTQLTGAGLAETNGQTFDVAWEASSGDGLVVYGTGTTTAYRVYTTASGFAAAGASPVNPGEAVNWLSLAGDWDTDYIAIQIMSGTSTSTSDALADIWNGTNWTTIAGPTDDSDVNSQGYSKGGDVMWEATGDRALFVYRDGATSETLIRYVLYDISANQWQAIEDGTHCLLTEGGTGTIEVVTSLNVAEDTAGPCTHATALAGNVTGIKLTANPANSQIMVVASNETALPIRPELLRWNGDANGSWLTQTGTMGAPETDASWGELPLQGWPIRAYDFAFNKYSPDLITISGTIFQTNETSAYDCSAVTAVTVRTATNGGGNQSADCTGAGGTYSIATAIDPGAADIPVVVFIDSGEAVSGTTVTLSSAGATNITNLDIFVGRVSVTQESATAITNAHLAAADNADAGIRYAVSGGNLTVESNSELHVDGGKTFAPGGNITTQGTGGIHVDDSAVLTGASTQTHVSASSIAIDASATYTAPTTGSITAPDMTVAGTFTGGGTTLTLNGTSGTLLTRTGTFTAGTSTVVFNGDGSATALTSGTFQTTNAFNNVSLTPAISTAGRTYAFGSGALTIDGNLLIEPSGTQLLTVQMGADITVVPGKTTTIQATGSATSSLDLRPSSTDYNLSSGLLVIGTGGTLDGTSTTASTITLTGTSGTLFTRSGTFAAGGSTVVFNPDAAVTLTSGTFQTTNAFNNVSLTPAISSAGRTYTFGAGAVEMNGDFLIQPSGTQLLTVAMAGTITVANNKTTTISRTSTATSALVPGASNPALSSGNITVAAGGTLDGTSSSSVITLTANGTPYAVSGTYTPGSTTIAYVPASTTGVTVASGTYYNVTFNKASNTFSLAASGITATNDLTITAGVLDAVSGSNFPITVGRNWTNTPGTGGFLAQNGTVTFNTTTTAAITGATIFHNFTAVTAPKTINFGDATTFRINGVFTLTGSAGPNYITLDSVSGGATEWTINHQGTESITYASVKNSACDGTSTTIDVTGGTNYDAGNNDACWLFASGGVNSAVWKLDDATGTSAQDASGNGTTGTLAGASLPEWTPSDLCVAGPCLYFEGSTAKVTTAQTVTAKSVSFWIRPTSTTTTILQLTATKYISASSGTLSASGFSAPTIYVNGVETTAIVANRWQHIAVTTGTSITADAVILGNNSTNFFQGFMDEVKLDSAQYTAAQVKGEYVKRGSIDQVSAQFGADGSGMMLSDGLVGYWPMDEVTADTCGASNDACDASGNAHDGAWTGDATTSVGTFGSGVTLDGSGDYVNLGSSSFSDFGTGAFTVSAWVNTTSADLRLAVGKYNFGSDAYWLGINGSGLATFSVTSGSVSESSASVTDGAWHLLTGVRVNDTMYLYIDGELVASAANSSSASPGGNLTLGSFGGNFSFDWYGKLDDVRIYDRGLDAREVLALYNSAPGPVGYWNFDENTGSDVNDTSGNGNTGSITTANFDVGKMGSSLNFDSSDRVSVTGATAINIANAVTVEAWVRPNVAIDSMSSGYPVILMKRPYNTAGYGIWLNNAGDNTVNFQWCWSGSCASVASTTVLQPDTWYHVAATLDTSTARIFINGIQENTASVTTPMASSTDTLTIGNESPWSGTFEGKIDEVKIYNYARTSGQVVQDMNGNHPSPGSPVGSALAYYKFDEGYGDTVYDTGINPGNGDLEGACPGVGTCPTWRNDGKYSKALNFAGDEYVSLGNESKFDNLSALSISVWVQPTNYSWFQTIVSKRSTWGATTVPFELRFAGGYNGSGGSAVDAFIVGSDGGIASTTTTAQMPINNWYHLGLTWDGSTIILYINGKEDNRVAYSGTVTNNNTTVKVGRNSESNEFYTGLIDELKIYDFALTKEEMAVEYNAGKSSVMGSLSTAGDGVTADNSSARSFCPAGDTAGNCANGQNPAPVGRWSIDEGTGTSSIFDSSGNGYTGTMNGTMTQADWVAGKFGSALEFDGSDDFIDVGAASALRFSYNDPFTVEAWIKWTQNAGNSYPMIVSQQANANNFSYSLDLNESDNKVYWSACKSNVGCASAASNSALTENVWYHVVGTFDGNSAVTLYVNGAKQTTAGTYSYGAISDPDLSFNIGDDDSVAGDRNWTGSIDEVRVYPYLRTQAQIAWDYNQGAPFVWLKFDECTGTSIYNSALNGSGEAMGNNGTLVIGGTGTNTATGSCSTSGAWFDGAVGKINGSMDFDGTDDFVDNVIGPSQPGSNAITVAGWIKPASKKAWFISPYNNGQDQWIAYDHTNSRLEVLFTESADTNNRTRYSATNSVPANTWTHYAVTINDKDVAIYINGKLDSSYAEAIAIAPWGGEWTIGHRNSVNSYQGLMDDFRIYTYAMTPTQVREMYNSSAVGFK